LYSAYNSQIESHYAYITERLSILGDSACDDRDYVNTGLFV